MGGSCLRSHIQVRGAEHLEASLARGRGVIAASTHFGFPQLLGPVLAPYGLRSVAARRFADGDNQVTVSGDVWARAGALQRLRTELRAGAVCVFLVDGAQGDALSLPFLKGEIRVGLGAFKLAGLSGSPIVPYFGMLAPSRGFTVEFYSALEMTARASQESVAAVVGSFLDRYASAARHEPSHIPVRVLGTTAAEP
jgi:lauroyl/myristoyl acyltransferase